uniref:C2H2-type domain-containing protein n=1 Tax=viral metagenome TaxID=1070528 RepID=A0A6C0II08_9ZZZZ
MENSPKHPKIFTCDICHINTSNKKDYFKHLLTAKHMKLNKRCEKIQEIPKFPFYCDCGNIYKHSSGLWRHKKSCNKIPEENVIIQNEPDDFKNLTSMVIELMKSNTEMQKQMVEMCKNSNTNTINSNNNNNNKTFNLQFFLNEQCKDAMNISDFANSIDLQLSDFESVGELGYVEGITKIMLDKLNSMDIYKRPIHCSDAKREILYVKDDDKWEKEEKNNPKLRYAIKTISFNNMKLMGLWSNTYPESMDGESRLNDKYMKLIKQSTGGNGEIGDSENKIIRRIAKEILIGKNKM